MLVFTCLRCCTRPSSLTNPLVRTLWPRPPPGRIKRSTFAPSAPRCSLLLRPAPPHATSDLFQKLRTAKWVSQSGPPKPHYTTKTAIPGPYPSATAPATTAGSLISIKKCQLGPFQTPLLSLDRLLQKAIPQRCGESAKSTQCLRRLLETSPPRELERTRGRKNKLPSPRYEHPSPDRLILRILHIKCCFWNLNSPPRYRRSHAGPDNQMASSVSRR